MKTELYVMCKVEMGSRVLVEERLPMPATPWLGAMFPIGALRPGESIPACAARVFQKDTGLTIRRLKSAGMIQWYNPEKGVQIIIFLFKTKDWSGRIRKAVAERVRWVEWQKFCLMKRLPLLQVYDDVVQHEAIVQAYGVTGQHPALEVSPDVPPFIERYRNYAALKALKQCVAEADLAIRNPARTEAEPVKKPDRNKMVLTIALIIAVFMYFDVWIPQEWVFIQVLAWVINGSVDIFGKWLEMDSITAGLFGIILLIVLSFFVVQGVKMMVKAITRCVKASLLEAVSARHTAVQAAFDAENPEHADRRRYLRGILIRLERGRKNLKSDLGRGGRKG